MDLVNLFGGGDRARARLFIAELQASQAEFSTDLMLAIADRLVQLDAATGEVLSLQDELESRQQALQFYELGYASGQGSTLEYFGLQDAIAGVERELCAALNQEQLARLELVSTVVPDGLGDVGFDGCRQGVGETAQRF